MQTQPFEISQHKKDSEAVEFYDPKFRVVWATVHMDLFRDSPKHDFCERLENGEIITVQISEVLE